MGRALRLCLLVGDYVQKYARSVVRVERLLLRLGTSRRRRRLMTKLRLGRVFGHLQLSLGRRINRGRCRCLEATRRAHRVIGLFLVHVGVAAVLGVAVKRVRSRVTVVAVFYVLITTVVVKRGSFFSLTLYFFEVLARKLHNVKVLLGVPQLSAHAVAIGFEYIGHELVDKVASLLTDLMQHVRVVTILARCRGGLGDLLVVDGVGTLLVLDHVHHDFEQVDSAGGHLITRHACQLVENALLVVGLMVVSETLGLGRFFGQMLCDTVWLGYFFAFFQD